MSLTAPLKTSNRAERWGLVLTHGATDFYTGAVVAMEPYLISERHYDYAAAAGITLAATSLSSVAQPVFGYLSDRFLLRPFILVGLLAAGIGLALGGLTSSNYWLTWVLVAVSGIGVAAYHPPATIDAREAGGGDNRSMSVFSVGGNIGTALAPLAVSISVGLFGLDASPLLVIPAIAATFVYLLVHRRAAVAREAHPHSVHHSAFSHRTDDWPRSAWLLVTIAFWSISYVGTNSFIALYLIQRFHTSAQAGSVALIVLPAAGAVGTLAGGHLADRLGRMLTIRAGYLIAALALLAVVVAPNIVIVIVGVAIMGCAIFLPFAPQITLSHAYLPRHIGTASGVSMGLLLSLGGFLTPALGHLADSSSVKAVFVLMTILTAIGFLCSIFLTERRHHVHSQVVADSSVEQADDDGLDPDDLDPVL